jgi:hypothetical protein
VEYQREDGTPIPWSALATSKEGKKLVQPDGIITDAFSLVYAKHNADTTKLFFGILSSGNVVFGGRFRPTRLIFSFNGRTTTTARRWPRALRFTLADLAWRMDSATGIPM